MTKSSSLRVIVAVFCVLSVALIFLGGYGVRMRTGDRQETILSTMRIRALLMATGEGAVESFVATAKKDAVEKARAAGAGMAEVRQASEQAEAEARERVSASLIDYQTVDTGMLEAALTALRMAMIDFSAEEARAKAEFIERNALLTQVDTEPSADAIEMELLDGELSGLAGDGVEDLLPDTLESEEPAIDLSSFQDTPEMIRLSGLIDERYLAVSEALQVIYPVLDNEALQTLKQIILPLVHQNRDDYQTEYDRYTKAGVQFSGGDAWFAWVIRHGVDLAAIGIALIIVSMMLLFNDAIKKNVGVPLIIIGSFFILLCVLAVILELSITGLLSNAIVRMGMNSIMVLAMVPAIQCGIGLNLGLPVGIIGGLIGGLLCIEYGFSGWWGFLFANVVGLAISAIFGYLYSMLLNRLKGSEMAVTTYVGFSFVSLMCIAWLVLPFQSLVLKWPLGNGLRTTISLEPAFYRLLDRFLAFTIGGITIPTGLIAFMLLACFLAWLFTRSKTGIAMQAVGNNPRFAAATGVNVDKMRIIGTMLSTMLGAVGILVYSQSYGFIQLYTAPRTLGLIAASAILIGGASTSRARISHVMIGTFLFHSVMTLGMPVANALIPGSTIAETIRILVSNGIILYALTKSGGESRA